MSAARTTYTVHKIGNNDLGTISVLKDSGGEEIAQGYTDRMEEIARACNHHDLLVTSLDELATRFERCCIHSGSDKEFAAAAVSDYRALVNAAQEST